MVADVHEKMIYWIDSFRKTIEKSDYQGNGRKIVRRITGYEFTSLTLVDVRFCLFDIIF